MKRYRPITLGLFIVGLSIAPQRAKGPPPPVIDDPVIPGTIQVTSLNYWIAPFVKVSQESAARYSATTVTWYSQEGPIRTQRVDYASANYVTASKDGKSVIFGVSEPWQMTLPPESDGVMTMRILRGTRDSRVLLDQYSPDRKEVTARVYVHGKLVNTLGPYLQYLGRDVELGEDGSTATLVWKDAIKSSTQLVLSDPEGKESAKIDCLQTDKSPIPAPGGIGAILPLSDVTHPRNNFTWYTPEGRGPTFEIGPNPRFVAWVPDSMISLFDVGLGFERSYQMIDWASGKLLWNIPCPGEKGYPLAVAVTKKLVIFSVAEIYKAGPWRGPQWIFRDGQEWIRTFYAVRIEDGSLVAKWQAQYASRLKHERNEFFRIGTKLYYVTSDEFSEIFEDDILAGSGKWKR